MAYVGNKKGLDVTDFRGGKSRTAISYRSDRTKMYETSNAKITTHVIQREAKDTAKIISGIEQNKEFILSTGRHCSIIKRDEEGLKYLELQSPYKEGNGWKSFGADTKAVEQTLKDRFGCRTRQRTSYGMKLDSNMQLIEVDSVQPTKEFTDLLGYLNTATDAQKKGVFGSVK